MLSTFHSRFTRSLSLFLWVSMIDVDIPPKRWVSVFFDDDVTLRAENISYVSPSFMQDHGSKPGPHCIADLMTFDSFMPFAFQMSSNELHVLPWVFRRVFLQYTRSGNHVVCNERFQRL